MIATNPETTKIKEYAVFDVLRFVLASAVLLSHEGALTWSQSGNLAVQVFFALSGWLIGGILCETHAHELSRFYFNRSTRIWIPYFVTVFALYLTSFLHESVRSSRWSEFLIYDVTFTHDWFSLWPDAQLALSQMPLKATGNHFWSLAVEEQFYLIAPLIIVLIPFGRRIGLWVLIAALAYLTQSYYASISFGVLLAVIGRSYPDWYLGSLGTIGLIVITVVSGIAMLYGLGYSFVAPFFSASIVLLCARPIQRNRITRWLGAVSFPFYLNAWMGAFVFNAIERHFAIGRSWLSLPAAFLAGLAAGAISNQIIDMHVMEQRNRYYRPALGWTLGAMGYLLVISGIVYWIHPVKT